MAVLLIIAKLEDLKQFEDLNKIWIKYNSKSTEICFPMDHPGIGHMTSDIYHITAYFVHLLWIVNYFVKIKQNKQLASHSKILKGMFWLINIQKSFTILLTVV